MKGSSAMKKLVSILLILVLCTSLLSTSFADIDLSGMSIEDLNALIDSAKNAILQKGGDIIISEGFYTVGDDIAPGAYEFISANPDKVLTYELRDKNDVEKESAFIGYESYRRIKLEDGDRFELRKPCYMHKAAKIGFFG